MRERITATDKSKPVTNADGERVGQVIAAEDGTADVDPDPGLTEELLAMLGWAEPDDDSDIYRLQSDAVDEITDEEIRLKEF